MLNFIGRVLSDEKNLTEEVVVRYVEFHEWWSRELAVEFPKGWKSFVSWFLSPYLDHAWKIENLVKASVHTAFSYQSKEALSVLATSYFDDYPEQVLTVIENYIGHQLKRDQRWELELKNALPDILRRGHHHDKEDIRGKADELLGRLVSEGFMKYREIAEE